MKQKNTTQFSKRIIISIIILLSIYLLGSIGYMIIEDMSFLDAFFMTTITITTVGYEIVKELSTTGTIFTIILIIIGTGTVVYILINITDFFLSDFLLGRMEKRRVKRMISKLKDHYIICGLGRVGLEIVKELEKNKASFIVIDTADEPINMCKENNWPYVQGNASNDETLIDAGIKGAKGLFAALNTDSENVYVTLSAKALNPSIFVVARAAVHETIGKLEKAGADKVISPQILGGRRMAAMALQPSITDFLDIIMKAENIEIRLAEIEVRPGSRIENLTIREASRKYEFGALIISILEEKGRISFNKPSADTKIKAGQKLIVMGTKEQVQSLTSLAST